MLQKKKTSVPPDTDSVISEFFIEETASARNFFTCFLMYLDVNSDENKNHPYYTIHKNNQMGLDLDEPEYLILEEGSAIAFDSDCKKPEEYADGKQPFILDEPWEFLDEITSQEEIILKNTWRYIRRDLRTNGHLVFMRFLNDHPEYREYLNKTIDLDESEIDDNINPQLSDLGYSVMQLLDRVVANLSNPKICSKILFSEGFNYAKYKLHIKHFLDFQESMLAEFTTLLHNFTQKKQNAWKKFLTIIMGIMEDASHWNDFGNR